MKPAPPSSNGSQSSCLKVQGNALYSPSQTRGACFLFTLRPWATKSKKEVSKQHNMISPYTTNFNPGVTSYNAIKSLLPLSFLLLLICHHSVKNTELYTILSAFFQLNQLFKQITYSNLYTKQTKPPIE